jgi:ABC-2 type transport system ATP-binding protein
VGFRSVLRKVYPPRPPRCPAARRVGIGRVGGANAPPAGAVHSPLRQSPRAACLPLSALPCPAPAAPGASDVTALALEVRNLKKAFGDVVAVDGLDLEVRTGECFGLLGPNGAGKTTTIEICEGLQVQDSGQVRVLGLDWRSSERELRERLGVQLQETQLPDKLTVEETVTLFRSFYRTGRPVDQVIDLVELGEKRTARIGKLSGGQKQRVAVACAIVGDPDLLFLDEPTTGLDPQSRRQLWDLVTQIKGSGRTVLLTTHYMDEAQILCDRVAIVDHGRVIALGTPRELIASLGAGHVVAFAMADGAEVPEEMLRALPAVTDVRRDGGGWELRVEELHRTVPALLGWVAASGAGLARLQTHSATLEDVFVALTGRQLRDG